MFVDAMKHSKIELSVQLSLCIYLYIYCRRISSNDGIWLYANIALALHRGCRLNERNLLSCVYIIIIAIIITIYFRPQHIGGLPPTINAICVDNIFSRHN